MFVIKRQLNNQIQYYKGMGDIDVQYTPEIELARKFSSREKNDVILFRAEEWQEI